MSVIDLSERYEGRVSVVNHSSPSDAPGGVTILEKRRKFPRRTRIFARIDGPPLIP